MYMCIPFAEAACNGYLLKTAGAMPIEIPQITNKII